MRIELPFGEMTSGVSLIKQRTVHPLLTSTTKTKRDGTWIWWNLYYKYRPVFLERVPNLQ